MTYIVSGNGFMYNMVRILMGTLLDIGAHRLPEDAMEQALKSGCRGGLGAYRSGSRPDLMAGHLPGF